MTTFMARAVALAFGLCLWAQAGAGVIYDNGGFDTTAPFAVISDFDPAFNPNAQLQVEAQSADDFSLQTAAVIRDVHWWGIYAWGDYTPDVPDDFTIRVFGDDAGQPGTLLAQRAAAGLSRDDAGIWGSRNAYSYSATVDEIPLPAGIYYLSIVNNTVNDTDGWFWLGNTFGAGTFWQRHSDSSDWMSYDNTVITPQSIDLSFNLTDDLAIPEPASLSLLALGLAALARRRRRR